VAWPRLGEWAYAAVLLMVLALVKWFSLPHFSDAHLVVAYCAGGALGDLAR
jgi:hypothetical protein